MLKRVYKLWGHEEWLVNNEKYCAKYLYLNRGYQCSLHIHHLKDETFYIKKGRIELEITIPTQICGQIDYSVTCYNTKADLVNGVKSALVKKILKKGDQIRILPYTYHRFKALTKTAKILEVSTTHSDSDSYRIEQSCKID